MNALLQETSSWTDTVDLALCLFIYEVCNDYQFDFLPGSDFVNFLNLKPASRAVTVRPKENLRVCYMVLSLIHILSGRKPCLTRRWKRCRKIHPPTSVSYTHLDVYKRQG